MSTTPTETPDPLDQLEDHLGDAAELAETIRSERAAQAGVLAGVREQLTAQTQRADKAEKALADHMASAHPVTPPPVPEKPGFILGMAYKSNTDPSPVEKRLAFTLDSRRTYYGSSAAELTKAERDVKANIAAGRKQSSISFKLPFTWAEMAAGRGDAWAIARRDRFAALVAGTGHVVKIAFHHEPENDTNGGLSGATAAGRDAWKAMQVHLAPIFDQPGFLFIVIIMGIHSVRPKDSLFGVWKLDLAIPNHPAIKGVGYDLYQFRGRVQAGKTTADGWSPQEADYETIRAFHATRPGLAWGLSETAHTEAAEAERPGLIKATLALVVAKGGSWLEYFNSNLNSTAEWEMAAGSAREKSFAAAPAALR